MTRPLTTAQFEAEHARLTRRIERLDRKLQRLSLVPPRGLAHALAVSRQRLEARVVRVNAVEAIADLYARQKAV